jgi:flagellar motor switch protein FliN/FliY
MANDTETKQPDDLKNGTTNVRTRNSESLTQASPAEATIQNEEKMSENAAKDANEKPYAFSDLHKSSGSEAPGNIEFILDIPLEITVELGRTKMFINKMLKLGQGSVIGLSKLAGETLDVLANNRLIARGEVVVVDEKYGIRLTEIVSPTERVESLK